MAKLFISAEGGAFLVHVDEDLADGGRHHIRRSADRPCARRRLPSGCSPCADPAVSRGWSRCAALRRSAQRCFSASDLGALLPPADRLQRSSASSSSSSSSSPELRVERLRQLGAVAVKRVGFQRQTSRRACSLLAILDRRVVGHVDGLGDRAGDEGLAAAIIRMWLFDRQEALAGLARTDWRSRRPADARPSGPARLPVSWHRSSRCWPRRSGLS